jgi:hypothetical protein
MKEAIVVTKKKVPELQPTMALHAATVDDPDGEAWHGEANARWAEAELADPATSFLAYTAPALPTWSEKAPAHVTRELLGRFLQDRGTRVVHDVYRATPECAVDEIRNGTFFHFWSEVLADSSVADDLPCPNCMAP